MLNGLGYISVHYTFRLKPMSQFIRLSLFLAATAACLPAAAQESRIYKRLVPTLKVSAPTNSTPSAGEESPPAPGSSAANLTLSSQAANFGFRDVGGTYEVSLQVNNPGTSAMSLSDAPSVTGQGFSASTNCTSELSAGAECIVNISFSPTDPVQHSGALSWAYATGRPALEAQLAGVGRAIVDITSVSPQTSSNVAGQLITVTGAGFADGTEPVVRVGQTEISRGSVSVVNDSQLQFTLPAMSAGTYSLAVTSSKGSTKTLSGALTVTAPLGGVLTSIMTAGKGTLPTSHGNCSAEGAIGFGEKSYLVPCMLNNWGGNLFMVKWDGASHVLSTVYRYNTLTNNNGIGGVEYDPRGFVVVGQGNYNMTSSFRIRTMSATGTAQTSFISENVYNGLAGANYGISAIARDPSVAGGYVAILRSSAAGAKTLLKFTVNDAGVISNLTAVGSRAADAPTLPALGVAVAGNDGNFYVGTSRISNATGQSIVRVDAQTGAVTTAYASPYNSHLLAQGLGKDAQGHLYVGTTSGAVYRAQWTGSNYGALEVVAGALGTPGSVDGPLGTNRMTGTSSIIGTGSGAEMGVLHPGTGGSAGIYRVLN